MKQKKFILSFLSLIISFTLCFSSFNIISANSASLSYYETSKANVSYWSSPTENSNKIGTIPKAGTVIQVSLEKNQYGNIWAKVGSGTYKGRYIYSGYLKKHQHTQSSQKTSTTYTCKDDIYHTKKVTTTSYCKCGYKISSKSTNTSEKHTFSNGKCTKCKSTKVSNTTGNYDTNTSVVQLYSLNNGKYSKSTTINIKGTWLPIDKVTTFKNSSSNYSYLGRISSKASSQYRGKYIFMNTLTTHTHKMNSNQKTTTTYTTSSDTKHAKTIIKSTVKCACGGTAVKESKNTTLEKHTFKNGKCTKCKATEVKHSKGTYKTIKAYVGVYEKASSGSKKKGSIEKQGTSVKITSVTLNSSTGNYWGKIGSGPYKNRYIYMGHLK